MFDAHGDRALEAGHREIEVVEGAECNHADGAGLRRRRVDVVEMLEAFRVLERAEQRQPVAPLALIRECRNGQAKPAEQRGQQRHGAGLEQRSTGQAQGNLQHYRADKFPGDQSRARRIMSDFGYFGIQRALPSGKKASILRGKDRAKRTAQSKTAGRGPGRLKLRQFRLTVAARPPAVAQGPGSPAAPGQAAVRARERPAEAARAASPAPRLPWSAAARGCPTGCSGRQCRSARSVPLATPANVMLVPGTQPFGLWRKWLRSSTVQLPPLAFSAAE